MPKVSPKPWHTPEPIRKRLEAAGWSARRWGDIERWFMSPTVHGDWADVELRYLTSLGKVAKSASRTTDAGKGLVDEFLAILAGKGTA